MDSTTTSAGISDTTGSSATALAASQVPSFAQEPSASTSPAASQAPTPEQTPGAQRGKGCIDGFTLKVVAIVGMTTNHIAHVLGSMMPWQATLLLHVLGGTTYAIMAFLMVEGYTHTSNLRRYATRLLAFAAISQVPFSLCFGAHANVLFTLLMGLFLLWAHDSIASRGAPGKAAFTLIFLAITALSYLCDWAIVGPAMVWLFYITRNKGTLGVLITMALPYVYTIANALVVFIPELQNCIELGAIATSQGTDEAYRMLYLPGLTIYLSATLLSKCASIGYALIGFTIATVCICNYNGKRGRPMKWFFYTYYPAHLTVIWGVKQLLSIV